MDVHAFEALADENRLAIVRLLADGGESCVCDVSERLGISNALASHHLKKLREAGLVETERKGVWLHCRLDRSALGALAAELGAIAAQEPVAQPACCAPAIPEKETAADV